MSYIYLFSSVLIGVVIVLFLTPKKLFTKLLLAFSGSYLLSVAILHLLPEIYTNTNETTKFGILILFGIVIQSVLESFSKGAEHGHIHINKTDKRFPILLFCSICVHAFSEGLPIHHAGESLLWGIIVHKIPISIVLTSTLINSNYSKTVVFEFLLIFALMSPLGVFAAEKIKWFQEYGKEITAVIVGVFLHISTIILFESTENHKFNTKKFTAIILGILLTIFTL